MRSRCPLRHDRFRRSNGFSNAIERFSDAYSLYTRLLVVNVSVKYIYRFFFFLRPLSCAERCTTRDMLNFRASSEIQPTLKYYTFFHVAGRCWFLLTIPSQVSSSTRVYTRVAIKVCTNVIYTDMFNGKLRGWGLRRDPARAPCVIIITTIEEIVLILSIKNIKNFHSVFFA